MEAEIPTQEEEEEKGISKEDFLDTLKNMEELMNGITPDDEDENPELPHAEREDDEESEAAAKDAEAGQDEIA